MSNEITPDELLTELSDTLQPVADKISDSSKHALFCIGVRSMGEGTKLTSVQAFFAASGAYDLLYEAFYAELRQIIEEGEPGLFYMLSDVVADLAEDLNLSTEQEYVGDPNAKTLH